jgi:hypothetical protein
MPILVAGTIDIVHIEQVSALFTFRLGQVLLYLEISTMGKVQKPSDSGRSSYVIPSGENSVAFHGGAIQRYILVLAYVGSELTKFHAAGWKC